MIDESRNHICFIICIIAQTIICVLTPIISGNILTISYYTIHLVALFYLFSNISRLKNSSLYRFDLTLLLVICLISSVLSSGFHYDTIVKIFCFLEMPFFCIEANQLKSDKKTTILIEICCAITALGFLYQYTLPLDTHYNVFFLGLNKNFSGLLLSLNLVLCLTLASLLKKWRRMLFILLSAGMSYLIIISRCRTAQVVLILGIIIYVFFKKVSMEKFFIYFIVLFPLLFLLLITIFPSLNDSTIFSESGDLLDGRDKIYASYFDKLKEWFLFGDVNQYAFANAHNGALSILVNIGVLGYVVWCRLQFDLFFLIRNEHIYNASKNKINIAYFGALLLMLLACMEAGIYVQGQQVAVMYACIFYLIKIKKEE